MPTCRHCGAENETADLRRHEYGSFVVVHCPDCDGTMGSWRDPARRHPK